MKKFSKAISLLYLVAVMLMVIIGSIGEIIRTYYPTVKEFFSSISIKIGRFFSARFSASSRGLSAT